MGCEANPRFETGGILGMLNGWMNGKRTILRLFDEARLDTGSIVDWLHWRLGEGEAREGNEHHDGDWMI
jgi:hypothetical protein